MKASYKQITFYKDAVCCNGIVKRPTLTQLVSRVFVLISFLYLVDGHAQRPIVLKETTIEVPITRNVVEVYEDKSAKATLPEIQKVAIAGKFLKSEADDLLNANKNSAYWLKFIIIDSSMNQRDFLLEIFDYHTDEISCFYPDENGRYHEKKAGYGFPFSSREVDHKNIVFPIHVAPTKPTVFYMRFKSERLNVLEPIVRSNEKFINYGLDEYLLFGIFYGIMLLIIFYNTLYLVILRKLFYLYYVIYACSVMIYLTGMNGTGFQYLWNEHYWLNPYVIPVGLGLGTIAMMKFFMGFFRLKERMGKMSKVLDVLVVVRLGYLLLELVYPTDVYLGLIDILYIQIIFYFGKKLYTSGVDSAKWFIIAFSILNVFCMITFLEHLSVIPSSVLTVYSINIGVIFQFIFMSVGMAESVRDVYRDRNKAQRELIVQYKQNEVLKEKVTLELEQKVKERTLELEHAKQEIEKRADENLKMNIALDEANYKLQKYLTAFAKNVVMNTHVDFDAFKKAYPDDLSCMRYLAELKNKKGFYCKRCGCTKSIKGKAKFDVRCSKCNYNESITANTIFHRVKFPLQKAFYMVYMVSQTKSDISATELCKILELQKATCLNFKNKIVDRMEGSAKGGKGSQVDWESLIMDREGVAH